MLILADKRIPKEALKKLTIFGKVIAFETKGIVYEVISGHPDIFFCKVNDQLIIAPNLPEKYIQILKKYQIPYLTGEDAVGSKYPTSSKYNALADNDFLIHNFRNTDSVIIKQCEDLDLIHIDQSYTRCNLISLAHKNYITSDQGIARTLKRFDLDVLYVDPEGILLPKCKNGFIGGCCGISGKKIFFIGKLDNLKDSKSIKTFLKKRDFEIIELYNGPLFDGGSLIFL